MQRLAGAKDVEGNYIFPTEVRVPCELMLKQIKKARKLVEASSGVWDEQQWITKIHKDTWCCQGRGWLAATDGWIWWRAVNAIGKYMILITGNQFMAATTPNKDTSVYDDDPETAFFTALTRAVEQIPDVVLED